MKVHSVLYRKVEYIMSKLNGATGAVTALRTFTVGVR
jgi:hypothetical protein